MNLNGVESDVRYHFGRRPLQRVNTAAYTVVLCREHGEQVESMFFGAHASEEAEARARVLHQQIKSGDRQGALLALANPCVKIYRCERLMVRDVAEFCLANDGGDPPPVADTGVMASDAETLTECAKRNRTPDEAVSQLDTDSEMATAE